MDLHPDWIAFLSLLRSHEVRFVVVGAHALAAHGHPRYTGDLDVLLDRSADNAKRVLSVLTAFGFGGVGLSDKDFTRPNRVAQLGFPPVRIDLLTTISGVSFRRAWEGRMETKIGGIDVAVLGARELVANKRAAGRPKDVADVAALEQITAPKRPRKTRKKGALRAKRAT